MYVYMLTATVMHSTFQWKMA